MTATDPLVLRAVRQELALLAQVAHEPLDAVRRRLAQEQLDGVVGALAGRSEPSWYLCWLAAASTAEERERSLASVPAPVRSLFRVFWWPAYSRRVRRLYGARADALLDG